MYPLVIVGLSIAFIIVAVAVVRLHAFFSLLLAAAFVALLTAWPQAGPQRFSKAIDLVMAEFGSTAGKLGCSIALAAVIGFALMDSGAADKIVRRLVALLGESRAALALCGCSFFLAGPVFVDTVFMLMLPIARALSLRTGRDYALYVMAIGAGAVVANGVVPPAPGPLFVAEALKLPVGKAVVAGFVFGILPVLAGLAVARWISRRCGIPLRPLNTSATVHGPGTEVVQKADDELPGFWVSIAPVLLPLALIAIDATFSLTGGLPPAAATALHFLGNKNVALALGAVVAVGVQASRKGHGWRRIAPLFGPPLETAGVIILIVAAGGAYGAMIRNAKVGDSIQALAGDHPFNPVLLAWTVTALIRGAQGSATVATIAGASIMTSIAGHGGLGVSPVYIFLAIGFGSKCFPWMNDAGFWIVSRMSGLTQTEMLRTWSPVLSLISILGLLEVFAAAQLWPQLPF
jgi:GntP family gluconate:H+ symporter